MGTRRSEDHQVKDLDYQHTDYWEPIPRNRDCLIDLRSQNGGRFILQRHPATSLAQGISPLLRHIHAQVWQSIALLLHIFSAAHILITGCTCPSICLRVDLSALFTPIGDGRGWFRSRWLVLTSLRYPVRSSLQRHSTKRGGDKGARVQWETIRRCLVRVQQKRGKGSWRRRNNSGGTTQRQTSGCHRRCYDCRNCTTGSRLHHQSPRRNRCGSRPSADPPGACK